MTKLPSILVVTILFSLYSTTTVAVDLPASAALPQAHAHNDYHHQRPLHDALRHGFCNVEADIFLHGDQLLVGHDRSELRADRTLQALYLDPLRKRVAGNQGQVYRRGRIDSSSGNERAKQGHHSRLTDIGRQGQRAGVQFTLLVDIKSDGPATFAKLDEVLAQYPELCSTVDDGILHRRAIDVIVSGNRPIVAIEASNPRRVFVDGRIRDLDAPPAEQKPALLVPLISDNWSNFFSWRGEGPMPADQRRQLRQLVTSIHQRQQRLRFWATPDDPRFWSVLVEADVDVIGTDDLGALQQFLSR